MPLLTLLCARNAKRSKPPNGTLPLPVQYSASRNEGESTFSVPSILSVGRLLAVPSKARLSGADAEPQFDARRLAGRARPGNRSASGWRQPFARARRIGRLRRSCARSSGQATWKSTSSKRSAEPFLRVVHHDGAIANADLRERRSAARIWFDRMSERGGKPRPVRPAVRRKADVDGRPHQSHVGDFDPSGEQRKIAQPRRQSRRPTTAGCAPPISPSSTS